MFSNCYQNFLIFCLSLTFLFNHFRCNSKLLTLCVIQLVHLKWQYRADCYQLTRMCDVIPFEALKREGKGLCWGGHRLHAADHIQHPVGHRHLPRCHHHAHPRWAPGAHPLTHSVTRRAAQPAGTLASRAAAAVPRRPCPTAPVHPHQQESRPGAGSLGQARLSCVGNSGRQLFLHRTYRYSVSSRADWPVLPPHSGQVRRTFQNPGPRVPGASQPLLGDGGEQLLRELRNQTVLHLLRRGGPLLPEIQ